MKIVGALWQYIKSNRLQDSDNREHINCNQELLEIFGEEKIEFSSLMFKLKDHLFDITPVELTYEINLKRTPRDSVSSDSGIQTHYYDLPVNLYSDGA
jgi:chromatin remodeling complex protein RSC6